MHAVWYDLTYIYIYLEYLKKHYFYHAALRSEHLFTTSYVRFLLVAKEEISTPCVKN